MGKNAWLIVCALVTVAAIAYALLTAQKQGKLNKSLEEERYSRMVAEEISQKSAAKLASLQAEVKAAEGKMSRLKDILDEQKGLNSDLKNQYDRLTRAKADLESKLQAALDEKVAIAAQQQAAAAQAAVDAAAATAAVPAQDTGAGAQ